VKHNYFIKTWLQEVLCSIYTRFQGFNKIVVFDGITLIQESSAQMNKLEVHVSSNMTKE